MPSRVHQNIKPHCQRTKIKLEVEREQFHLLETENVDVCASQRFLYSGKGCLLVCWGSSYSQVLGKKTIIILLYSLHVTWTHPWTFSLLQNLSDENLKDFPKASFALQLLSPSNFPHPTLTYFVSTHN